MLTEHSNAAASTAVSSYHALFDTLVARFHDGYCMKVQIVAVNKFLLKENGKGFLSSEVGGSRLKVS